jgi:fatty acid desaturase
VSYFVAAHSSKSTATVVAVGDPRCEMAVRLPRFMQPFLTWLTAVPAPGERHPTAARNTALMDAAFRMGAGAAISVLGLAQGFGLLKVALLLTGAALTTSGMSIVQVIIFHYCAHAAMFRSRPVNQVVGRFISIVFLFSDFDKYRADHIQHHRAEKLITEDDEFSRFVVRVCRLQPGEGKKKLWAKTVVAIISPIFHGRFFVSRVRGNLLTGSVPRTIAFGAFWGTFVGGATYFDIWAEIFLIWILPLTVLLQVATIFRILCEHRFPPAEILSARGKLLLCYATIGVFPGRSPPALLASSAKGAVAWMLWWFDLLTIQLFSRVVVLVGDAPCHDFHHRRPGTREWFHAHYARQQDKENGCPGYPMNYIDVWGLFEAIDLNLEALANASKDALAGGSIPHGAPSRQGDGRNATLPQLTT